MNNELVCTHDCQPPDFDRLSRSSVGMFWQCPTCRELWTVTEQTTGYVWAKAALVWRDEKGKLLAQPIAGFVGSHSG